MLALDLFNTKYERELTEGAVDDLEARRIDTLNDRMQDLLARAREPAYKKNPAALSTLKQQFQQVKDERDSYYKVREAGIPGNVPVEKIPGKEDLLKGQGRSYYEDQKKNSEAGPLDQKLQRLKVQARRQFPRAHTDDEALVLKLLDKETQDDQLNRQVDARQDAELRKNFALDREQEDEIEDLQTQVGVKEHGGGIGPKQRWQDLMPEQMNPEDYEDEDEDEDLRLRSGDYVRDTMDSESGEIFRMQGDPYERRVRILDRDGKGWYIEPSRLTRVDPADPDVQRYFGKNRQRDMDEGQFSIADDPQAHAKILFLKTINGNEYRLVKQGDAYKIYVNRSRKNKQEFPSFDLAKKALQQLLLNAVHTDEQGVAEGKADYNFDADDLKRLERIGDLPTLKTQALALISRPSAKPMKPEKVEWFKNALDRMNSPIKVIKLMYDLLLSGEGHAVVGSRSSMNPNSYRQRFGEQGVAEESRGSATRRGQQDYAKGLSRQQNPYYKSQQGQTPPKAYDWEAGWEHARDAGKEPGMAEGWSDAMVARRTGQPRTPYSVYIKGRKWKDFENEDLAQAVMNRLKAKFRADGRDPETITIAPTDMSEAKATKTRLDPKCWTGKKIGNPKTKVKGGVRVNNCVPAESIQEDQDSSGVERAILNRIMVAHTDLLMKFGPDKVMQAAEEVAYNVGDIDEIGTSDVSAYVQQVMQILGATP